MVVREFVSAIAGTSVRTYGGWKPPLLILPAVRIVRYLDAIFDSGPDFESTFGKACEEVRVVGFLIQDLTPKHSATASTARLFVAVH